MSTRITMKGVPTKFLNKVLCFTQTMEEYKNPFSCYSKKLYVLDICYCVDEEVVKSLNNTETKGHDWCEHFYKNVFKDGRRNIYTTVGRNLLKLFKSSIKKAST